MPRSREFDPDDTLRRAMHLFWRQGYEATSLADLVAYLGVARAGIYQEFGGKRELFLRALALYTRERDAAVIERLQQVGSPLRNVQSVVEDFAADAVRGPRDGCLVTNSAVEFGERDPVVGELVHASWHRLEQAITSSLTAARRQGEVASEFDPRAWARTLVVLMQGLRVLGRSSPQPALARAAIRTTLAAMA